jgi:hypothetical protein
VTSTVDLAAGERRAIPVEELGAYPVLLESTSPIVAEREIVVGSDRASAMAVPDAATATLAEPSLFDEIDHVDG